MITVGLDIWKTELLLSARTPPNHALARAMHKLLSEEVDRLDRLASRFRADSELTRINADPGQWIGVSWGFVAVMTAALDAAGITGGLVDPTLGRAIKAAGYDRWAGQSTPTFALAHTGRWRAIGIRPGRSQAEVRIPANTELDLGSIAKAWLADRLAVTVRRAGLDVCANMGGDIRVIADTPWTVWSEPATPGTSSAPVDLVDGALATSGVGKRAWRNGHHIIDPRSGRPARTQWRSVSAVAATAVHANAAATAGVILAEQGPAWMDRHSIDARFVAADKVVTTQRWLTEVAA